MTLIYLYKGRNASANERVSNASFGTLLCSRVSAYDSSKYHEKYFENAHSEKITKTVVAITPK